MNDIKGIHYSEAEFDKNGKLKSDPNVPAGTTDLIVVSHGWNNNRDEAERLYTKLFGNFVEATKNDPAIAQRKLAIIGIIWPAKRIRRPHDPDHQQRCSSRRRRFHRRGRCRRCANSDARCD